MSGVFFTSDQHFGHARIVELSSRPFGSIEEHDEAMIERWNKAVRKADDIVWVLGDFTSEGSTAKGLGYLPRLNGRKRLVAGNHDRAWAGKSDGHRFVQRYLDAGFELVTPFARAKVGSTKVNLSHFGYTGDRGEDRYAGYRLPFQEVPVLHGHTHSTKQQSTAWGKYRWVTEGDGEWLSIPPGELLMRQERATQVHVGVDAWDYAPVSVGAVEEVLNQKPPQLHRKQ